MSIEEMRAFFAARVDGYDQHMLTNIEGMEACYARVASLLDGDTQTLLDLGCGTGLELAPILARFPSLSVTGIDLTPEMLEALRAKYPGKALRLLCGDYFAIDFGSSCYDAAVSVESLHHFTHAQKLGLYRRIRRALRPGGLYVEADYTAASQQEEDAQFAQRRRMLEDQNVETDGHWHFDTPCTAKNQLRLLAEAGFERVAQDAAAWGATAIFTARRPRREA